jgi:prevent-host-death family protein
MQVTLTEAKANLGHYVDVAQSEDVIILRHGRQSAKLTGERSLRREAAEALFGLVSGPVDWEAERLERLVGGNGQ